MRKIYKLCIGIALSAIIVACADKLDSDKYFKDRRSLEDVFTDKENTEEWLAHAYSFLNGYNLEVSMMLNTITNFADDIYFGGNSLAVYKEFKTGTYDESYRHSWSESYKGIQTSLFLYVKKTSNKVVYALFRSLFPFTRLPFLLLSKRSIKEKVAYVKFLLS